MRKELVRRSKFLSLVLRHDPSAIGIRLDEAGWFDVDVLLNALRLRQPNFTREVLDVLVATNEKKRFAFSEDGKRIRASQGHSIGVDLGLQPVAPPEELYHGTAGRNLESIRASGLTRGTRDHVHLSPDTETAIRVGMRHGKPVVLVIHAAEMAASRHALFLSENGVWLTEAVPPEFIDYPI